MGVSVFDYEVTFFFVSGQSFVVEYREEKFRELINVLAKNWMSISLCGDECGLNFHYMTHYEVKKLKS